MKKQDFVGTLSVYAAWCDYYNELNDHIAYQTDLSWADENRFFTGVHRITHRIAAARISGGTGENPFQLYDTDWIPIANIAMLDLCKDAGTMERGLVDIAMQVESAEETFLSDEKPLILVDYGGNGLFLSRNLKEQSWMYIRGYSPDDPDFSVSKDAVSFTDKGQYTVHSFPQPLYRNIGLSISVRGLSLPLPGEEWKKRELRPCKQLNTPSFSQDYADAIWVANWGRSAENTMSEQFSVLELRLDRFEQLDELGAPESMLAESMKLILKIKKDILLKKHI